MEFSILTFKARPSHYIPTSSDKNCARCLYCVCEYCTDLRANRLCFGLVPWW